jgi:hypothetical protein
MAQVISAKNPLHKTCASSEGLNIEDVAKYID